MRSLYRRHYVFMLVFLLFVSFRLLAILLFRPGGFITDFSDYDFYYTWGNLIPMGYRAYDNLWTAYPPLFPALMLSIFEVSSRIPPWVDERLAFHVLFGLTLLLFESGSFILIYRLGNRLGGRELATYGAHDHPPFPPGLVAALLYALFFVPVYTLIGWFEPMPLFFMLLGLDLLLANSAWSWGASAVAAGLGFLTKLTPILLVPIAVRWLGAKLSWHAFRKEWFKPGSPGNIAKATAYVVIFLAVVLAVGYPFVRANPTLAFSSFRVQDIRPPWQSIWALMDGFYGYGLVPLDMRNIDGLSSPLWDSHLPWMWIGLLFVAVYLWLYTRPYDWESPQTPITFSGVSVLLLFLYSKGWSPQFLLWVLVYIALLLPTLRGVVLAIVLSLVNFIEADVFLIMLPEEHWIMVGTVLLRTSMLILLIVEFLGQIWPRTQRGIAMRQIAAYGTWTVVAAAVAGSIIGFPRAAQAYGERRLAEHPCEGIVEYLQNRPDPSSDTVITQQSEVWRDLYPWLRSDLEIHVLDGYSPTEPPETVVLERFEDLLSSSEPSEFWWIERSDAPASPTSPLSVRQNILSQPEVVVLEEKTFGSCTLFHLVEMSDEPPVAVAAVSGGPIDLLDAKIGPAQAGGELPLVLYWRGQTSIDRSYTVFTQLLDKNGTVVAQQDNLPVRGLAPTDTWQPGAVIRDPYALDLSGTSQPGPYVLLIGLYDSQGERVALTLADGTVTDNLSYSIRMTE